MTDESSPPTKHGNKIIISIFLIMKAPIHDTHGIITSNFNAFCNSKVTSKSKRASKDTLFFVSYHSLKQCFSTFFKSWNLSNNIEPLEEPRHLK